MQLCVSEDKNIKCLSTFNNLYFDTLKYFTRMHMITENPSRTKLEVWTSTTYLYPQAPSWSLFGGCERVKYFYDLLVQHRTKESLPKLEVIYDFKIHISMVTIPGHYTARLWPHWTQASLRWEGTAPFDKFHWFPRKCVYLALEDINFIIRYWQGVVALYATNVGPKDRFTLR